MASGTDGAAASQQNGDNTGSVVADELYAEGVDSFAVGEYEDASNSLAQCLEAKVALFGPDSLEAAHVAVKYGAALLACVRARRDDEEPAQAQVDDAAPSTSAGPAPRTPEDAEADDLQLAWEVSDSARLVLHRHTEHALVTPELLMELHETLGDLATERDMYDEAVSDYEQAIKYADESASVDLRQLADLHARITVPLELSEEIDPALKHVNTALQQVKFLVKQKEAERQEAAAAAAAGAEGNQAGGAEPGGDAAAAEGSQPEGDEAALAMEVSELRSLIIEHEERKAELTDVQGRVSLATSKVKEMFSTLLAAGGAAPAGAADANGASTSARKPAGEEGAAGASGGDAAPKDEDGAAGATGADAAAADDDERPAKRGRTEPAP